MLIKQEGGDNMSTYNKEIFSKNLKNHMATNGKDRKRIAADLNIAYSTLTDWVNGKKFPRIEKVEMLADYFGISKSDLIEDFEEVKKDNDRLVAIIAKLRTNKELVDVVERLVSLDKAKLESLSRLLDTFI